MYVVVTCTACGLKFKVQSRFAGRLGACPNEKCGRRFLVPSASRETEPAELKMEDATGSAVRRSRGAAATLEPPRSRAASAKTDDVAWLYRRAGVEPSPVPQPRTALDPARRQTGGIGRLCEAARRAPGWTAVAALALLLGIGIVAGAAAKFAGSPSSESATASDEAAASQPDEAARQKAGAARQAKTALFDEHVVPYMTKYCADCHSGDQAEAGVILDGFANEESARKDRPMWEKVVRLVEANAMPPADHPARPTEAETKQLVVWLDARVFHVDCDLPSDPGRVTVRRLNRNEYNNTIRDLVGVDFHPAEDFPSDDVGYGFDNIGDVLSLPPLLMEKYLDAAEKITEAAIVVNDPKGGVQTATVEKLTKEDEFPITDDEFVSLFSAGEVSAYFDFPLKGEYVVKIEAKADQAGPEVAKMEVRLGAKALKTFEVQGERRAEVYDVKFEANRGRQLVEASFLNDYYNPKAKDRGDRDRNLYVKSIAVQGPLGDATRELPETHTRLVLARPEKGADGKVSAEAVRDAAKKVLLPFARRAFRRPATDDDIEPFVKLVEFAVQQGDQYERGLQVALQGILCSPHFLFRIEQDPDPNDPKAKHAITDFELATRLSYFLWSSMPDEGLFQAAERGELHQPEVLERQVKRMLADAKSRALVENFGGQWLNLRNLDEFTPDPKLFPEFTAELRADMRKETELFLDALVREDRSLLDVIDGRYTYLNDRLARHYGVPWTGGSAFEKVPLTDNRRGGVLTQASILALTSDPNKTSPVKRGKWVLENILGTPPPPPPPNVPEFDVVKKANPNATLREQLALHLSNATCASCHKVMDPIGLGFENFDPLGRWREKDGDHPIDPAGTLPGGESFASPAELRTILKGKQDQFVKHFLRQLLTYALGRGLEDADRCAVDEMAEAVAKQQHRFSAAVLEVVRSKPFLMRRGER